MVFVYIQLEFVESSFASKMGKKVRKMSKENVELNLRITKTRIWKNSAEFVLHRFLGSSRYRIGFRGLKLRRRKENLARNSTLNEHNFTDRNQNVTGKNTRTILPLREVLLVSLTSENSDDPF